MQVEREGEQGGVGRGRTGLCWSSGLDGYIELYSLRFRRGTRAGTCARCHIPRPGEGHGVLSGRGGQ